MAFIKVNGAHLYYETYGQAQPGRAPLVLIHGSTNTGHYEWGEVAPLLARHHHVIALDCRGHGQSDNPGGGYSFKAMAADTAGLVHSLGYQRAHILGHSNGGNVALVTLLEYPEVVQSCVLQAANAYISPDLVEKEPSVFDPDRVAREDPAWMNDMIRLHSATHGADYWRELLRITLQEIVSQPNYTPDDLARVARPTLVVQGEKDRVNAPARHAQFIARHIPDAELWIPSNIAHNVHKDIPCPWLERVLDFLARRGDDVNDALYRLERARYADKRQTIFEVRATPLKQPSAGDAYSLAGRVLRAEQRQAALQALPIPPAEEYIQVLLDESTPWALVKRCVADVRRQPSAGAEQVSQALVGEAVRTFEECEDWVHVLLERDTYLGWMRKAALQPCRHEDVLAYQAASDTLVQAELAQAYDQPFEFTPQAIPESGLWVGKLPWGVVLPAVEYRPDCVALRLPDDHVVWVARSDVMPASQRPAADAAGIAFSLDVVKRCVGVPYYWGGRSPFGFDCSGLAQTFLRFIGIDAPRDADQQYLAGRPVEGASRPGDLLFFGGAGDEDSGQRTGGITHVAISLGGDDLIHANGTTWSVAYNSLNPDSPCYSAYLCRILVGVRRFVREDVWN